MIAALPNFLREDDSVCSRKIWDSLTCVQVDPMWQVSFISQLAAVEGILPARVEQVEIIGLLRLSLGKAEFCHTLPNFLFPIPGHI